MKDILIFGLGISGKSALEALKDKNINLFVYDDFIKSKNDIPAGFSKKRYDFLFSEKEIYERNFDFVMKSPGIKPSHEIIKNLEEKGTKIISDLELGYIFNEKGKLITITGTNGKTTTTTLINKIIKENDYSSEGVGNIGKGAVSALINNEKDFLVIEASSFQLDNIEKFKSDISIITNIETDHLDYHKTKENYVKAKLKLLKNLKKEDMVILNHDDKILKNIDGPFKKVYVSVESTLKNGYFYKNDYIYKSENGIEKFILDTKDLNILGVHNYYNIMFSLAVSDILKLDLEKTLEAIYNFKGIKHRLEFVRNYKGRLFFNDSKGTNTQSTMMAIKSFDKPINIILGGYDKGEDFNELLNFGKGKIRSIYCIGETKDRIYNEGKDLGYKNIYKVDTLEESIKGAFASSKINDIILLSPACASWGMFKNFEERGDRFVEIVESLEL